MGLLPGARTGYISTALFQNLPLLIIKDYIRMYLGIRARLALVFNAE
jgi:hypothetical protein